MGPRRALAALLIAVSASCGDAGAPGSPRAGALAPDVLLVIVDTLRADRTTAVDPGLATTPRLSALGDEGIVFRCALAPAAWTLPSMAALFAARDAIHSRHAAFDDESLAERFARAGYRTVGLVANPLLTSDNGFERGFLSYEVAPSRTTDDLGADLAALRAWDAEALVGKALRAIGADDPRPVFVFLHLMDPHVPYDPANKALAPPAPGWSVGADGEGPPSVAWAGDVPGTIPRAHLEHLGGWRRAYDAQIAFVDRALGRLLDGWAQRRPGRARLTAVTSDHGEGLFSHARNPDAPPPRDGVLADGLAWGYHDHGEQVYEEAVRVPLWLAGPGVPAGRVEMRPVPTRALGPTLLQLAGLPAGEPTLPLDDAAPVEAVVLGVGTRDWFARSADAKLVVPFPDRAGRRGVAERLFALDPGSAAYAAEREDLIAARPQDAARLREVWEAWIARHDDQAAGAGPDPATEQRLRELGYLR